MSLRHNIHTIFMLMHMYNMTDVHALVHVHVHGVMSCTCATCASRTCIPGVGTSLTGGTAVLSVLMYSF